MLFDLPPVISRSAFPARAEEFNALDDKLMAEYAQQAPWGMATALDLGGCNAALIRDPQHIERFVIALCDAIAMKRYGEPIIVRFGADPQVCGYSLAQLIETSLISGHFAEATDAAYIDIFSCKPYRPYATAQFCSEWFSATNIRMQISLRQTVMGRGGRA
jgi:S-adenosylmethionine/arginine decarboxylase-like enzyme